MDDARRKEIHSYPCVCGATEWAESTTSLRETAGRFTRERNVLILTCRACGHMRLYAIPQHA